MSHPLPALAVAVFFLWSFLALAQSDTATVSGQVTGQTDKVLVGADVDAINAETGVSVAALTNIEGVYVLPDLRPGRIASAVNTKGRLRTG